VNHRSSAMSAAAGTASIIEPTRAEPSRVEDVTVHEQPPAAARTGKQNLVQFVLTQHSLTGLCFSKNAPPPIMIPGCCCCVCADKLSVRHRLFVLAFVLVATWCVTVEVAVGVRSAIWQWFVTLVVVMPLTCVCKSTIGRTSAWLQAAWPFVEARTKVRVEEWLLVLFLVLYVVYGSIRAASVHKVGRASQLWVTTLLGMWGAEVVCLVWKAAFCRVCCPCIVSACCPQDDFNEPKVLTNMLAVEVTTAPLVRPAHQNR